MGTDTKSPIACIGTVFLMVTDVDRSLEFYRDKLGFDVRTDTSYGDGNRWVEVAPPGAETVLALVTESVETERKPGGNSPFGWDVDDLESCVAALTEAGVEFDGEIMNMGDPVPPMIWFFDPDRNRTIIVQRDAGGLA